MTDAHGVNEVTNTLKAWRRSCSLLLNIVGLLVGGSTVYQHIEQGTVNQARDFDSILVVKSKQDLVELINRPEQRSKLIHVLGIYHEASASLACPDPDSLYWDLFDAVRLTGFTREGVKKSVKIITEEHLRTVPRKEITFCHSRIVASTSLLVRTIRSGIGLSRQRASASV